MKSKARDLIWENRLKLHEKYGILPENVIKNSFDISSDIWDQTKPRWQSFEEVKWRIVG